MPKSNANWISKKTVKAISARKTSASRQKTKPNYKKEMRLLGEYLKKKRLLVKLSQGDIAKLLEYSNPQFVSNFERGLCSPPMNKLKILIKIYNIPPKEMTDFLIDLERSYLSRELTDPRPSQKNK